MKAKVIKVIETESMRGAGVKGSPIRRVVEYWSLDGNLLAEQDQWKSSSPKELCPHEQEHYDKNLDDEGTPIKVRLGQEIMRLAPDIDKDKLFDVLDKWLVDCE